MRLKTETTLTDTLRKTRNSGRSHRLAHPLGSPNTTLRCEGREVTRWQQCVLSDMGTEGPDVLGAELVSEGAGAAEGQEGLL